jgi:hypothetical protein
MRERAASNIGETGDEEVSRLAVSQQIVVTVSAGVPIYVVLQYSAERTHAARIHSDHAEYLRRRDDGLDAGGAWESGEAGDRALMDVSGRVLC